MMAKADPGRTAAHPADAEPDALFVLSAGNNDMRDARSAFATLSSQDSDGRQAAAEAAIADLRNALTFLAGRNARHVLISNLPDLGRTPEAVGLGLVEVVRRGGRSLVVPQAQVEAARRCLQSLADQGSEPLHDAIRGVEQINKVIQVDQQPLGQTPTSNPATYTGVFDLIRTLYSQLPESRLRGYTPRRFSFNVPGGRCEACEGNGQLRIEMHFLPDVWVECETCRGKRYNPETLGVTFHNHSISDVLDMTCGDAVKLSYRLRESCVVSGQLVARTES
mgnify:CR=1 FL=1